MQSTLRNATSNGKKHGRALDYNAYPQISLRSDFIRVVGFTFPSNGLAWAKSPFALSRNRLHLGSTFHGSIDSFHLVRSRQRLICPSVDLEKVIKVHIKRLNFFPEQYRRVQSAMLVVG